MCKQRHCVPTFTVIEIQESGTEAILFLDGNFSECRQNFKIRIVSCRNAICSGLEIVLQDCSGTTLNLWNRHANRATLGQVQYQAARHGCLHVTRSTDSPHNALWQDWIDYCTPTPIIKSASTSAVAAVAETAATKAKK